MLQTTKEQVKNAYANQDLPFDKLIEHLKIDRDSSFHPLFQVMFSLEAAGGEVFALDDLQIRPYNEKCNTSKFDLSLTVTEGENCYELEFEYSTKVISPSYIKHIAIHYQNLISDCIGNGNSSVISINIIDELELQTKLLYQQQLVTKEDFSTSQIIDNLIYYAEKTPEKIAVSDQNAAMNYGELLRRVRLLGSYLQREGVTEDSLVGVCNLRSNDYLVCILSIYYAGGAYIPLDPSLPAARLEQMVTDSRLKWLLTATEVKALNTIKLDCKKINIQTILTKPQPINSPATMTADALAYVLYTSGTTGKPKGVMIEQRGLVNHLQGMINDLELTSNDIIAQNAPQCFDVSVWQFLVAVMLGGQVTILAEETIVEPSNFLQVIAQSGVTILQVVPSFLRCLMTELQTDGGDVLKGLRYLLVTGEAVTANDCNRWFSCCPTVPLVNAYGPAECSDDVALEKITCSLSANERVMIGKPFQNMMIYVLDEAMQPVPTGVAGEMYIGGVGVGRGYLYDETKTAKNFFINKYTTSKYNRLYKTGGSCSISS